jgi:hypothetical protein
MDWSKDLLGRVGVYDGRSFRAGTSRALGLVSVELLVR